MKRGLFRMLSLAVVVTAIVLVLVFTVFSGQRNITSSGECGPDLTWTLYKNDELIISGTGEMNSWSETDFAPWYEFEVKRVVIESGVTSIGSNAFRNLYLADVSIPTSVKVIGDGAFYGCIYLGDVYIPSSVSVIGDSAFCGCSSLVRISIPDGVTAIGNSAFCGCAALSDIVIPENVTSIGDFAFLGCSSLESIVIPKNVKSIGANAFENCRSLTGVNVMTADAVFGSDVFVGTSSDLIICGYPKSTAEAYAIENGNSFELFGMKFLSASLALYNDLAVNFKIEKEAFDAIGYTDPYLVFGFNGRSYTVRSYTVEQTVHNGKETEVYVFLFNKLAPDRINETITATLHAAFGGVDCEGRPIEYSVSQYCYNQLEKCTGKTALSTMCVDLLNYGAAAQECTGYNVDDLANAKLTELQRSWGTQQDRMLVDSTSRDGTPAEEKAVWKSASLRLKENVTVELLFETEDVSGLYVEVEMYGRTFKINEFTYDKQFGWYVAKFNKFSATHMSELMKATVRDADGNAVSKTLTYSVESYAQRMQDDPSVGKLVKALLKYGDAALVYGNEN